MAQNQDVAALLLDEFLRQSGKEPVFVDCLPGNSWVVPLLQAIRAFIHMPPGRIQRTGVKALWHNHTVN